MQDDDCVGLREQKRRKTRRRIEDSATKLVDEHGFGAVTVEEICADSGISRRTFFNYFDSKVSAVMGSPSREFAPELTEWFLTTPTDNVLELSLTLIAKHVDDHYDRPEIHARRQRIAQDSEAAAESFARKRAKAKELRELIQKRLENTPGDKQDPSMSPRCESALIASLLRESLWMVVTGDFYSTDKTLTENLRHSAQTITSYAKGLAW